ncbi:hypothetical protein [Roseibium sp. SCP14]|uniref:hypothetical protein n=1 Tax=Roseibium sp. SCP14 TaxID=3141375 RepID=UPI00333D88F4
MERVLMTTAKFSGQGLINQSFGNTLHAVGKKDLCRLHRANGSFVKFVRWNQTVQSNCTLRVGVANACSGRD